ncbi:MAG: HNH endonuclease [Terrisporobacter sp.]
MCHCEVCGALADIHHIVHKHEGGYDFYLNYKYLCPLHHRGQIGPHHCNAVDLSYKIQLQKKLYEILPNPYYTQKEISDILQIRSCSLRRLLKNLVLHKEGYLNEDIIKSLMGGKLYNNSMLVQLELEHLFNNTNIN